MAWLIWASKSILEAAMAKMNLLTVNLALDGMESFLELAEINDRLNSKQYANTSFILDLKKCDFRYNQS